ncbi:glucosylglycerol-phosphate synthase [Pontivivens insulae]|uniref:Glucosylglycerol-phosphate synthase n=1 Tax=Pontivivens insulae TaxID=1639689 RepID=A0A2R8AC45_9RHOB|nr:glucosylglycerol-phosphate synthase [Pontivivens insulae]RED11021.1 glucosyl-glycerol phosphate synthase [Pontivivens insulae]SPF29804.1 Glucosylglycerol-phosphate synthase [Pontivivens insulae]
MKSDLVIVYHRQPYEEVEIDGKIELRENSSPNGIVPTLKSFFGRVDHASWVAWKYADDPANPDFDRVIDINDSYGSYSVSRLPLTKEQVSSFYHVSSKEAFWPILHGFKERYNYDPVDWPTFRQVNWAFAEAAAAQATDDAVIWVHDYNLWLVPAYLRQLKPNARIAFFHHTPFPNPDLFNVLPWREEIIKSLLQADAVGFHIPRYSNNFKAVARSLTSSKTIDETVTSDEMSPRGMALSERMTVRAIQHHDHKVIVDTSPVGVDTDYIAECVAAPQVDEKVDEIRADLGDCKLIVSVSRTDYTKGNIEQLEAFERLLSNRPDLHGKVRLMHVSVGANRNMTAYEEIQQRIEELTGRINGTYGSFEWQPVALISTAIPFAELVAYYRAADVAWITPLADGLNLVASEFCAARSDNEGVLVLSEFAGTAVLLDGAIPVNPFSHASMDSGIEQALSMDPIEARDRMQRLRNRVARFDINAWVKSQVELFDRLRQR